MKRLLAIYFFIWVRMAFGQNAGALDATFSPTITASEQGVVALAIQPDGKMLLAGSEFLLQSGIPVTGIVRTFQNGSVDSGFVSAFPTGSVVRAIGLQSNGGTIVGGEFDSVGGEIRYGIARLQTNGAVDPIFAPKLAALSDAAGKIIISGLQVDSQDRIVVAGRVTSQADGFVRTIFRRLSADGSPDPTFQPSGWTSLTIDALALQGDGRLIVGSHFKRIDGQIFGSLTRLYSDGTLDPSFRVSITGNSFGEPSVAAIIETKEGKILVSGDFFFSPTISGFVRLNENGSIDQTFDSSGISGHEVLALANQGDGKLVLGGSFITIKGQAMQGIARIQSDGTLDSTFQPGLGANGPVQSILVNASGDVVASGTFSRFSQVDVPGVVRLSGGADPRLPVIPGLILSNQTNIAGQPLSIAVNATSFSPPSFQWHHQGTNIPGATGRGLFFLDPRAPDSGSYQVIVRNSSGEVKSPEAKLVIQPGPNTPGSVDITFRSDPGINGSVLSFAVQTNNNILIGGGFTFPIAHIAELFPNGRINSTFRPPTIWGGPVFCGNGYCDDRTRIQEIVIQPDGKILIGGAFTNVAGTLHGGIARLNEDGGIDTTFSGTGVLWPNGPRDPAHTSGDLAVVRMVALQPDGRILIAGDFSLVNGAKRSSFARLNADGTTDSIFQPAQLARYYVLVDGAGRLLVGSPMQRLLADGSLDTTFNADFPTDRTVVKALFDANRRIVLAGASLTTGPSVVIRRLFENGQLDSSFKQITLTGSLSDMALDASGKLIVVGQFSSANGSPASGIARFKADGALDGDFHEPLAVLSLTFPEIPIQSLLGTEDGRLLVGGSFSTLDQFPRTSIARLNGDLRMFQVANLNHQLSFQFPAVPDHSYQVEYSTSIPAKAWTPLQTFQIQGDQSVGTIVDQTSGGDRRYYHLLSD